MHYGWSCSVEFWDSFSKNVILLKQLLTISPHFPIIIALFYSMRDFLSSFAYMRSLCPQRYLIVCMYILCSCLPYKTASFTYESAPSDDFIFSSLNVVETTIESKFSQMRVHLFILIALKSRRNGFSILKNGKRANAHTRTRKHG